MSRDTSTITRRTSPIQPGSRGQGGRIEYINEYPCYRPLSQVPPSGLQVVDCSVYEYWCKAISWCNICAKLYYCYAADIVCRNAGSGPWRDCVCECLQFATSTDWIDTENTPVFGALLGCGRTVVDELAWRHLYCFSKCRIDPDSY